MGYLRDTVSGVSWVGMSRLLIRGMSIIKIPLLARFLTKPQIGVYSIAILVLAFLELLTEAGINIFLIQQKDNIDDHIDTAWIISIGRGIVISLLLLALTPFVVQFFNSPDALSLLLMISVVPFVRGFINPSVVKFQKELQFNKDFLYKSSVFAFDTVISLSLVFITRNPLMLIVGLLAGVFLEVILSFILIKPWPKLRYNKSQANEIFKRGKWVTSWGISEYFYTRGDNIVVGRMLGEAQIGVYSFIYNFVTTPVTEIVNTIYQVTFPIFVKMSHEKDRLLKAFWQTFTVTSAFVILISLGIYIFSYQILSIFFPPSWMDALPLLRVLAFVSLVRGILLSFNSLFLSLKKQNYVSIINFISMAGLFVTIVPFVNMYGITGAGMAALTGSLIAAPFEAFFFMKVWKELRA